MTNITFSIGELSVNEQRVITAGFTRHSVDLSAPPFEKQRLNWVAYEGQIVVGALTADLLWDWMYIDELWVAESKRGCGLGKALMKQAEEHAVSRDLVGLWLWTQSWQAAEFYKRLDYKEFTRFEDFPRGHHRIGFRKQLTRV